MTSARPASAAGGRRRAGPTLMAGLLLAAACATPPAPPPEIPVPADPELDAGSVHGLVLSAGLEELDLPLTPPTRTLPGDRVFSWEIAEEVKHLFAPDGLDSASLAYLEDGVSRWVNSFLAARQRQVFATWLAREGRYGDFLRAELRAAGLPEDLVYLAMIESGFNPLAVSRAKATGLWQFMRGTGREAGLRIDDFVDERRDPIAATRAAIRHLQALQTRTGDWALSAAAYNAGLGRVLRAQARSNRDDYFSLSRRNLLPRETRRYVPFIVAAAHLAHHRERYGFHVEPLPPLAYDSVLVAGRTRLRAVAAVAGLAEEDLEALNPHLLGAAAPPGPGWVLRVPVGSLEADFPARLASLPPSERLLPEYREKVHVVKSGDSWWAIARRSGLSVATLRARNPRIGKVIHPGMRIVVERKAVLRDEGGPVAIALVEPAADGEAGAGASAGMELLGAPPEREGPEHASQATAESEERESAEPESEEPESGLPEPEASDRPSELAQPEASDRENELAQPEASERGSEPRSPERPSTLGARVAPPATPQEPSPGPAAPGNGPSRSSAENPASASPPATSAPVSNDAGPTSVPYVVRRGDTLHDLARLHGTTVNGLVRLNGFAGARKLRAGERIRLPASGRHVVARGETLSGLARRYGVRVEELVAWNGLGEARPLRIGEVLRVRGATEDAR